MEIWKDVVGFEGLYIVSSQGKVLTLMKKCGTRPGKALKGSNNSVGYPSVALRKDGRTHAKTVHSLMMEAFVGPRPPGWHVNHIDCVRDNNFLENLEYVTPKQNSQHMVKMGRCNPRFGVESPSAKLKPDDVLQIIELAKAGIPQRTIAAKFGIKHFSVYCILQGRAWKSVTKNILAEK